MESHACEEDGHLDVQEARSRRGKLLGAGILKFCPRLKFLPAQLSTMRAEGETMRALPPVLHAQA